MSDRLMVIIETTGIILCWLLVSIIAFSMANVRGEAVSDPTTRSLIIAGGMLPIFIVTYLLSLVAERRQLSTAVWTLWFLYFCGAIAALLWYGWYE